MTRKNSPSSSRPPSREHLELGAARRTRQRDAVIAVLAGAEGPLAPAEIHARARRSVRTIGLSTIYRIVRRLEEEGLACAVNLPGDVPRYEPAEVARHHHHHFHCDRCHRVFDLHGCLPGLDALAPPEFTVARHEIVFYGRCAACA